RARRAERGLLVGRAELDGDARRRPGARERERRRGRARPSDRRLGRADPRDDGARAAPERRRPRPRCDLLRRRPGRRVAPRSVILLGGERVSLRPLRSEELEIVWQARLNDDTAPWMSTPQAYERLKTRVANSGAFVDGWLDLGIEADGRLVGEID